MELPTALQKAVLRTNETRNENRAASMVRRKMEPTVTISILSAQMGQRAMQKLGQMGNTCN